MNTAKHKSTKKTQPNTINKTRCTQLIMKNQLKKIYKKVYPNKNSQKPFKNQTISAKEGSPKPQL